MGFLNLIQTTTKFLILLSFSTHRNKMISKFFFMLAVTAPLACNAWKCRAHTQQCEPRDNKLTYICEDRDCWTARPGFGSFVKAVREATLWMNGAVNNLDSVKGNPVEKELKDYFLNQGNNVQKTPVTSISAKKTLFSIIQPALTKGDISDEDYDFLYYD